MELIQTKTGSTMMMMSFDDSTEWADTDGDGVGDNADTDDDDDGWSDQDEAVCGSQLLDSGSVPADSDADGECDALDPDDDDDGVVDSYDAFPSNPTEWADTDGDGIGNNADGDDDGDGWGDSTESDCGSDRWTEKYRPKIPMEMVLVTFMIPMMMVME